jgi:hypothetical protein
MTLCFDSMRHACSSCGTVATIWKSLLSGDADVLGIRGDVMMVGTSLLDGGVGSRPVDDTVLGLVDVDVDVDVESTVK